MSISTRTPRPAANRWEKAEQMQAQREASKKQNEQNSRRRTLVWVGSGVLVVLLGVGIWELVNLYKAHKHQQFINSIKDDPQQIRDAADAGKITPDEHEALRRDMGEERMNKMMDTYFALSGADRAAWMQQRVKDDIARRARWEQMQASGAATTRPWGNGGPGGNGNNNGQNQANGANNRTARYESRDPNRTAQFQQFRADMAATYKQMGLQPPQFGRR
jgi:hypothetical protein